MGVSQFVLSTKYYLGDAIRDGMCGHPASMENVINANKILRNTMQNTSTASKSSATNTAQYGN
jgi:pyruvate/2-oxoglutarate dehydrogenase complex dihydrolipoamide dehydrogenase (E3) component